MYFSDVIRLHYVFHVMSVMLLYVLDDLQIKF